jgi:hypothetical protein
VAGARVDEEQDRRVSADVVARGRPARRGGVHLGSRGRVCL